jgi:putative ABC transport system ATP-binding protein
MPAENSVEVHHLKKSVGQGEHELSILTGVELVVKRAETIALIGESGSGKSTLLAILAGLDDGSSGEVHLVGQPLHQLDEEAPRRAARARWFCLSVLYADPNPERAGKRRTPGAVAR